MLSSMKRNLFLDCKRILIFACLGICFCPQILQADNAYSDKALLMADFILTLQDSEGAIKDYPGRTVVNEDSSMEYALIGLAAAYAYSNDSKYLTALEKGIQWLAARENMDGSQWQGSWFYTYSSSPPYDHVATSPGIGITDVRGVDATSALFVYLLYLHQQLTGSNQLVNQYEVNAKAALDFVINNNLSPAGTSYSSWRLEGIWKLWKYQYTADQGDVYLGIHAGSLLYDGSDRHYGHKADTIAQRVPQNFFSASAGRYYEGLDEDGDPDESIEEFDAVFPQGYVPWVFGANSQNLSAYQWLLGKVQTDGGLVCFSGDEKYSLTVGVFGLAADSQAQAVPALSYNWLLANLYENSTGGVSDSMADNTKTSDAAGLVLTAFLGQDAWKGSGVFQVKNSEKDFFYSVIKTAYNDASSGHSLLMPAATVTENIDLDRSDIQLKIIGGYDSSFLSISGVTAIQGKVTISGGPVTISNILIK
jgi:hypothetical protein